jgi:hypothetical protein
MSTINLVGIASNLDNDDRTLAYLEIYHNNIKYNWQIFIPSYITNIQNFLDSIQQNILNDIDSKELIWTNLNPKTKTVLDPISNTEITIDISKEEIVKPDIPDYYSLRKNEYPSLGDQLDAMWKGVGSAAFISMQEKIAEIKAKYPKPY